MTDTPEQRDLVGLEAHPRATAIAEAPPGQLVADVRGFDGQTSREPLDDNREGAAVGLASG